MNTGWWVTCSSHALGFSQSNLHVCQNLIFMASLIHKVDFCLARFFFLKNVWLSVLPCYYGLTSLYNVHVHSCFSLFHNGIKKLSIVTSPSGWQGFFWTLFYVRILAKILNPRLTFKTQSKTAFILFFKVLVKKYIIDN